MRRKSEEVEAVAKAKEKNKAVEAKKQKAMEKRKKKEEEDAAAEEEYRNRFQTQWQAFSRYRAKMQRRSPQAKCKIHNALRSEYHKLDGTEREKRLL